MSMKDMITFKEMVDNFKSHRIISEEYHDDSKNWTREQRIAAANASKDKNSSEETVANTMFEQFENEKHKPSIVDMHNWLIGHFKNYVYASDHSKEDIKKAGDEIARFCSMWNENKAKPSEKTKEVIKKSINKKNDNGSFTPLKGPNGEIVRDEEGHIKFEQEIKEYDKNKFINFIDAMVALLPSPSELGLPEDTALRYAVLEIEDHNNEHEHWKQWFFMHLYIGQKDNTGRITYSQFNVPSQYTFKNEDPDKEFTKYVDDSFAKYFTLYDREDMSKDVARMWINAWQMRQSHVVKIAGLEYTLHDEILVIDKDDLNDTSKRLSFTIDGEDKKGYQLVYASTDYISERAQRIAEQLNSKRQDKDKNKLFFKLVYTEKPINSLQLKNFENDVCEYVFTRNENATNVDARKMRTYKMLTGFGGRQRRSRTASNIERIQIEKRQPEPGIYLSLNGLATIKNVQEDSEIQIKDGYKYGEKTAIGSDLWLVPAVSDIMANDNDELQKYEKLLFWMARIPFVSIGSAELAASRLGIEIVNKPKRIQTFDNRIFKRAVPYKPFIWTYTFKVPFVDIDDTAYGGGITKAGAKYDSSTKPNVQQCYDFVMSETEDQAKRVFLSEYNKFYNLNLDKSTITLMTMDDEKAEQLREEYFGIYDLRLIECPSNIPIKTEDGSGFTTEFIEWLTKKISIQDKVSLNPRSNTEMQNALSQVNKHFNKGYSNGSNNPNMPTGKNDDFSKYINYFANVKEDIPDDKINESKQLDDIDSNSVILNESGIMEFSQHLLDLCSL